jgi:hypothetical protein
MLPGEDELWWENTVRWARNEMKNRDLLAPSTWGHWRLNDRGKLLYGKLHNRFKQSGRNFELFVSELLDELKTKRQTR